MQTSGFILALVVVSSPALASDVRVCVDVRFRTHNDESEAVDPDVIPPEKPPKVEQRYPFPPRAYLTRLLEHFVTHERGFVSVESGGECDDTLTVELYPRLHRMVSMRVRMTPPKHGSSTSTPTSRATAVPTDLRPDSLVRLGPAKLAWRGFKVQTDEHSPDR